MIGAIAMGVTSLLPGLSGATAGVGTARRDRGAGVLQHRPRRCRRTPRRPRATGQTSAQTAQNRFPEQRGDPGRRRKPSGTPTPRPLMMPGPRPSRSRRARPAAGRDRPERRPVADRRRAGRGAVPSTSLSDAQFRAGSRRQENLTSARIQARLTLQQLRDAEKDAAPRGHCRPAGARAGPAAAEPRGDRPERDVPPSWTGSRPPLGGGPGAAAARRGRSRTAPTSTAAGDPGEQGRRQREPAGRAGQARRAGGQLRGPAGRAAARGRPSGTSPTPS